jgi:hypothetical protein
MSVVNGDKPINSKELISIIKLDYTIESPEERLKIVE